ncbi:hypothetical protein J2Z80_000890 [Thermoanaerobacterium butyriciformans]|uniref:Uncharacterized protein n=1 Tax=Thermoanaerobacterium butyriciformans TaxID=1702242 RepID=A0ABS4NCH7_9THEO|nr:hypothetical protein [Thermoanaerobacterium butyriciformans]
MEFRPIKNKDLLIRIADGLMRITPTRIEKVGEGWKLMIKT